MHWFYLCSEGDPHLNSNLSDSYNLPELAQLLVELMKAGTYKSNKLM